MQNLQSALGVIALIAFAWAISENRRAVSPRRVATDLAITLVLAVLFLKVPPITAAMGSANHVIDAIAEASRAGTAFVFGYVGGGPLPIEKGFAVVLNRTMGVGGAVGLSTAANIFVGHVEAPLFIRPYLAQLSRSELFVVMTGGMAGIAGTVLVLYAQFLRNAVPDAAGHLIIASVLGAPVAVMIGQIMVPDERDT